MQNLNKILEKIEAEAQGQKDAVWAEVQQKLNEMQEETDAKILQLEKDSVLRADREREAILTRAGAAAAMQNREILLQEKTALLEKVYRVAEEDIRSLPREKYTDFLGKLTANAVAERVETVRFLQKEYGETEFDGEEADGYTLLLSPADRESVGTEVLALARRLLAAKTENPPQLTLAVETAKITGGVVVRYGDTQTTCSIPVLLAGLRQELDPQVVRILFGEEKQKGTDGCRHQEL